MPEADEGRAMWLMDQEWNATLWGMQALRALPDEERVLVLEQARDDARFVQRLLAGFLIACFAAFLVAAAAVGFFDARPRIPPMVLFVPVLGAMALRGWRDRIASRSVRRHLQAARLRDVATTIASTRPPSPSVAGARS